MSVHAVLAIVAYIVLTTVLLFKYRSGLSVADESAWKLIVGLLGIPGVGMFIHVDELEQVLTWQIPAPLAQYPLILAAVILSYLILNRLRKRS